tara:strand:- start:3630 stop:4370 length:741 start_codon:yes stop_codon:yes gene_type:complete
MSGKVFAATLLLLWLAGVQPAMAESPKVQPPPNAELGIEKLGNEKFRIGNVIVDKAARRFSLPARVAHTTDPLEYFAVARGGAKEYESLLELDATATQFQLASILIGLDDARSVKPRYQFDERPAEGPAVDIHIDWSDEFRSVSITASEALMFDRKPITSDEWVYTGSVTEANGQFMAETIGSVISFVHDPFAIIDHHSGIGVGKYGSITGNGVLLPPVGATVTVSVSLNQQDKRGEASKPIEPRE